MIKVNSLFPFTFLSFLQISRWSFINTCVICYVLKRISSSMLHFSSIIFFIRSVIFFILIFIENPVKILSRSRTHVNKILGVDTQYTAKVKNLWNKFAQPMISLNWSWIIIYYLHLSHQFKWTLRSLYRLFFFQVLSQIPLRIKKKTFLFLSLKRKTSLNVIPGIKSRDRENSTRTESSFELMTQMMN
jgi:hypothetical protein